MDYRGPVAADYENVRTLNRAFLLLLRHDESAQRCLGGLPPELAERLSSLSDSQAARLSSTPFLLLSFRERDDEFWQAQLSAGPNADLFAVPSAPSDSVDRLISAGLSFIWQLAKQNAYAARLICGASLYWCEELTERTIFHLLATAGSSRDVLTLRCASDGELWRKLLAGGVSREPLVRQSVHISALHAVLTGAALPGRRRWAAAACAAKAPTLKVAEQTER